MKALTALYSIGLSGKYLEITEDFQCTNVPPDRVTLMLMYNQQISGSI